VLTSEPKVTFDSPFKYNMTSHFISQNFEAYATSRSLTKMRFRTFVFVINDAVVSTKRLLKVFVWATTKKQSAAHVITF